MSIGADLQEIAARGLTAEEQDTLFSLLQRVRQNIEQSESADPQPSLANP